MARAAGARRDLRPPGGGAMACPLHGPPPAPRRPSRARPPARWQTYDIVFHRPRFAPNGSVRDSARITVLHNGVLVQDNTVITGGTVHARRAHYEPHPDRLPLMLQDHGNPVRYREIWIRELPQ